MAAGLRLPAAGPLFADAAGWLRAQVAREVAQRRLFPWLAVAFGLGILAEFTLTAGTPTLVAPLVAAGLSAGLLPVLRARPVALALMLALVAALLGFAAAAHRVARVAGPVLARTTVAPLSGIVESLDEREQGARLIVWVLSLGDLDTAARPTRVRVSVRQAAGYRPGDRVSGTARLLPPPEPVRPDGYDFARDAWFRGIGAVGSFTGRVAVAPPPEALPWRLNAAASIDAARNALTRRIAEANGGQGGAVAAALVTGKRGLIAPETNAILRAAGIYHVVSISGLHMVLAAGVVFWLVRAGLCLVPLIALTWPVKKIAAGAAMVGVTAYCAFSGWDIAAERSLVMTLIMLGAILVERPALSMRNLALAALVALAREPEGLLGPSFQMSFGAVAGLIAAAPLLERTLRRGREGGRLTRTLMFGLAALGGTLATTLVAQVATAPFSTYHFQAVQPFGLLGNALTLPLVSLVVMPSAVLGIVAYPFALDQPIWWLMGLAVRAMLAIAGGIHDMGHANLTLPAFGPGALAWLALGLVLAALPASGLRWLALAPTALGLGLAAHPPRYDVYVDREGTSAALRGPDGRLATLGRPSDFVLEQWLRADGDGREPRQVGAVAGAQCDRLGCTATVSGRSVALSRDRRGLPEDCARADLLVTRLEAPPGCAARLILDRRHLAAHGASAIRFADGRVVGVRGPGRPSPWRPAPPARPEPAGALEAAQGGVPEAVPDATPPAGAEGESLQ